MSKTEKNERDIAIWAIPSENRAEVEGNSVEGLKFAQKELGTASKTVSINSDAINALMAKIKEGGLNFSFKVKA